jgi:DNA-directed RNA polymerase sigma subunit (sigma70/sigma32)
MEQRSIAELIKAAFPGESPDPPLVARVTANLATLTSRERRVLELRLGLEDGRKRTLKQVAGELNVTHERIRQIEMKARMKLLTGARSHSRRATARSINEGTD